MKGNPLLMLGLVMLASHSAVQAAAPAENCQLKQYAAIDLVVTDEVWVPVTLDDRQGWMALNTGSGVSVLWEGVASEFAVESPAFWSPRSRKIRFGSQTVTEVFARFKSLAIGNASFGKGQFLVVPRPNDIEEPGGGRSFGALGMDVLANVDFELDLAHKKLNLFSPDHCPGNVVYWTDTFASTPLLRGELGNLYFAVELDGRKIEATVATGRQTTTLSTDASRVLFGFDADSPGIEILEDSDSGESQASFRAMHITAPGLTVRNTNIQLIASRWPCLIRRHRPASNAAGYDSLCSGAYPVQLGRNVLEKLRLYFAVKEKALYYTAAQ